MSSDSLISLCEAYSWPRVIKLLREGVPAKQVNKAGREGLTPLHYACLEEQLEVTELLLQAGADPSAGDSDGTTCLHIAATLSNAPLAQLLLDTELPLEIDQQDFAGGSTALHMAVTPDDPSKAEAAARFVALLLERGADATVRDKAGKVASDYAELAPVRAALSVTNSPPVGGRRRRIATPTTDEPPAGGRTAKVTPADTFDGSAPPTEDLEASVGRRRRRRQGGVQVAEPAADEAPFNPAFERAEGRRRRRRGPQGAAASTGSGGSGGLGSGGLAAVGSGFMSDGDEASYALLRAQYEEKLERQLLEELNAGAPDGTQWDLALELRPEVPPPPPPRRHHHLHLRHHHLRLTSTRRPAERPHRPRVGCPLDQRPAARRGRQGSRVRPHRQGAPSPSRRRPRVHSARRAAGPPGA